MTTTGQPSDDAEYRDDGDEDLTQPDMPDETDAPESTESDENGSPHIQTGADHGDTSSEDTSPE